MNFHPIQWTGELLRLLDQTQLPTRTVFVDITTPQQCHDAIKRLVVRGAPAIGVSAAFGAYLGIMNFDGSPESLCDELDKVCTYLATSRPTAVNLFWALDRIKTVPRAELVSATRSAGELKKAILAECQKMFDEDARVCRTIGEHGLRFLKSISSSDPIRLLTHCNAGSLATVAYGTALAPIYVGLETGIRFEVFADETRPLLQGARLTAYELSKQGVPVTVICDNMAATVLRDKRIDAVIVGADRIARNGDTANKIGTLGVAILAKHYNVPFIVAAPTSTFDLAINSGNEIPIEERHRDEIAISFGQQTVPDDAAAFNPAFDVTPAELITAIVTERGVFSPPFFDSINKLR